MNCPGLQLDPATGFFHSNLGCFASEIVAFRPGDQRDHDGVALSRSTDVRETCFFFPTQCAFRSL